MEAALIGLVGVLIGQLLTTHFRDDDARKGEIGNLCDFLRGIAADLRGMEAELRIGQVPTTAGNDLKTRLNRYRELLEKAPLDDASRQRLLAARDQISQCLTAGVAEDDYLRGKILSRPQAAKEELLATLLRVAAWLEAEASMLPSLVQ